MTAQMQVDENRIPAEHVLPLCGELRTRHTSSRGTRVAVRARGAL